MQYPKLVESKTSGNEMVTIEWNPGMDLLATVFSNGALTCSRLLSLQKVWHKSGIGKIISIAWRPDGRVLVIGAYNDKTKRHLCTLHDVENGATIKTINARQPITSVAWFQNTPEEEENELEDSCESKKIKTPIKSDNDNFSHQLARGQTQLNILMIATEDGKLSFHALGLFYLGSILMHKDTCSKIVRLHMSSCLRYVTTVISSKHANTLASLKVLKIDTFQDRNSEILRVAKMYARITDELEYLEDTIIAITTSWADVLAGLDNKLSSYCSRKNRRPDESRSGYTFLSADELLQLLVIGFPSDNLEKFLADMSDKGLKKLNNAIEQTCLRVQNLIVKNAQKCCYHLHSDLNLLRGMSLWRDRFKDIGLDDKFITDAMRSVGSLMLKLTELQQVIDHSLKSTKSFFRWLISIACRQSSEQNTSSVPNEINKTTQQDIQLITDFILENFDYNTHDLDHMTSTLSNNESKDVLSNRPTCSNFTLEQVGQYFKNEPLSRLKYSFAKPDSNFWIEFFKQRPELTEIKCLEEDGTSALLFYPHNPDTSLLQEHKKACNTIAAAFIRVATDIKFTSEGNDHHIYLKDFVRNAPTLRIRVETDMRAMQHYTIFQTKQEAVAKQYLIVQPLTDEKTFKLISIEFHSIAPSSPIPGNSRMSNIGGGILMIADSGFYENKETRQLLLSFLLTDPACNDTIIVQLELETLIESSSAVARCNKEAARIFRTNDSIDKHSASVALTLDIYTEPASERQNGPEVMVKKIKSTIGRDMFSSSGRGVIAFTSSDNKRVHLYELESSAADPEIMDDEVESDEKIDESLIDTDLIN